MPKGSSCILNRHRLLFMPSFYILQFNFSHFSQDSSFTSLFMPSAARSAKAEQNTAPSSTGRVLDPSACTHGPHSAAADCCSHQQLTESFPQSCMALLSTTMLISCHLTAAFRISSQGFFALWPLAAACSASISSSSSPRSLLPLSFFSAARTRKLRLYLCLPISAGQTAEQ